MKNKLEKYLNSFIKDIENSAPNAKEKLKEIYPVKFKLNLNLSLIHISEPTRPC